MPNKVCNLHQHMYVCDVLNKPVDHVAYCLERSLQMWNVYGPSSVHVTLSWHYHLSNTGRITCMPSMLSSGFLLAWLIADLGRNLCLCVLSWVIQSVFAA